MIKINGAYVTGAPQFKLSGAYSAMTQYLKSGGIYSQIGNVVDRSLQVATLNNRLSRYVGNSAGADTQILRLPIRIGSGDVLNMTARFTGWYMNDFGVPVNVPNSYTINKLALETEGATAYGKVTFNGGSESIVINPGDDDIKSDKIYPSALGLTKFTKGQRLWCRMEIKVAAGGFIPTNTPSTSYGGIYRLLYNSSASSYSSAYGTGAISLLSGVAGVDIGSGLLPMWLGEYESPNTVPTWVCFGSSVEYGLFDSSSFGLFGSQGGGYISRVMSNDTNPLSCIIAATGSGTCTTFAGKEEWLYGLAKYARFATDGIGSNDIANGVTTEQLKSNMINRWGLIKAKGIEKTVRTQMGMRTSSTDSWATAGNQTYHSGWGPSSEAADVNSWLISQAGSLFDTYVPMPSYRDATDPWKWITNGSASYPTGDGIHPKAATYTLMANDLNSIIQTISAT